MLPLSAPRFPEYRAFRSAVSIVPGLDRYRRGDQKKNVRAACLCRSRPADRVTPMPPPMPPDGRSSNRLIRPSKITQLVPKTGKVIPNCLVGDGIFRLSPEVYKANPLLYDPTTKSPGHPPGNSFHRNRGGRLRRAPCQERRRLSRPAIQRRGTEEGYDGG